MREGAVKAKQLQQERGLLSIVSAREHASDEEVDQASVTGLGSDRKRSKYSREWIMQALVGICRASGVSSANCTIQLTALSKPGTP